MSLGTRTGRMRASASNVDRGSGAARSNPQRRLVDGLDVLAVQRRVGNATTNLLLGQGNGSPAASLPLVQRDLYKPRLPPDRGVIVDDGAGGDGSLEFNDKAREMPAPVSFGALNADGYGSSMYAEIYDWNHWPEGSVPTVTPPWWPSKQGPKYKKKYPNICKFFSRKMVQGHLLNHNIGGPGSDMRNLAPISKSTNKEHLKRVEEAAKELHIEQDEYLTYTVRVTAKPPILGAYASFVDDLPSAEQAEGQRLVNLLPRSFHCELQKAAADGSPLPAFIQYDVLNVE